MCSAPQSRRCFRATLQHRPLVKGVFFRLAATRPDGTRRAMVAGCFPRGSFRPPPAACGANRKSRQQRMRLPDQLGAGQHGFEGSAGASPGWRARPGGLRLEALPDGSSREVAAQDPSSRVLSRRNLLAITTAGAAVAPSGRAQAYPITDLGDDGAATRMQLLDCINAGGAEEDVQEAIRLLSAFNPTPSLGQSLQGNWKLLWSSDAAEVTKATRNLPLPFESMQLIGEEGGKGQPGGAISLGRAANLVKVLGGAVTLKLSSSAVPDKALTDAVIIGPPFRLELLVLGRSIPLQAEETTESDTSTILGNQLSTFSQLYLEGSGQPGDLRVSRVTAGDPVVLGSTFVHVRV